MLAADLCVRTCRCYQKIEFNPTFAAVLNATVRDFTERLKNQQAERQAASAFRAVEHRTKTRQMERAFILEGTICAATHRPE